MTTPGRRMFLRSCALTLWSALAVCAAAQPPASPEPGGTECQARMAVLEQDMAAARSRGQMLRRQQLADELAALRARCLQGDAEPGREARIAQLEREIEALRAQLGRAEEQLRKLKAEAEAM